MSKHGVRRDEEAKLFLKSTVEKQQEKLQHKDKSSAHRFLYKLRYFTCSYVIGGIDFLELSLVVELFEMLLLGCQWVNGIKLVNE